MSLFAHYGVLSPQLEDNKIGVSLKFILLVAVSRFERATDRTGATARSNPNRQSGTDFDITTFLSVSGWDLALC